MSGPLPKLVIAGLIVAVVAGGLVFMRPQKLQLTQAPVVAPVAQVSETPKIKRDMLEDAETAVETVSPVARTVPGASGRAVLQLDHLAGEITLSSPLLRPNEKMADDFTCYRKNMSPPLSWADAPRETRDYVVFFERIVQGGDNVLQWAAYNIGDTIRDLPVNLPKTPSPENGIAQGINDLGSIGYAGPCQRKGEFQYLFEVFALDTELKAAPGLSRDDLVRAMNGRIIDMARLPVTHYRRL